MTYLSHQIDHYGDFVPENDDDVCSCANDGDRLIEEIDDVISQMSGADFFYRENGGDQVLDRKSVV